MDNTTPQVVRKPRLGYRTNQREEIERLKHELEQANRRIAELEAKLAAKSLPE
jgi:predicted RNase H-like nuclease (RuvC/YqgF family)